MSCSIIGKSTKQLILNLLKIEDSYLVSIEYESGKPVTSARTCEFTSTPV